MAPENTPKSPATEEMVTRDSTYYSDHIVFRVDNRLFKVPRVKFERDSEVFRDMFALPAIDGTAEGLSDEHPLRLEGIPVEEFQALLRVMFRPHYNATAEEQKGLSQQEWMHVLKLSTMWHFTTIRSTAIDALTPLLYEMDPVQRIVLARKHGVREWLLPALVSLAERSKSLQLEEVGPLGIATVLKVAEARDHLSAYRRASVGPWGSSPPKSVETRLRDLFKEELQ